MQVETLVSQTGHYSSFLSPGSRVRLNWEILDSMVLTFVFESDWTHTG